MLMVPKYIADSQDNLYKAKEDYEKHVGLLGMARDISVIDKSSYEFAYAECLINAPAAKTMTIAKEIALIECRELYTKHLQSEVNVKKMEYAVRMFEEIIQTEKIFLKIKLGNMN